MKRKSTKILALLLVCALLMGTGYAYWTDNLNITSTATTGELDVTFVDFGYLAQYHNEDDGWSIIDGIGEDGYVAASHFAENYNYNDPGDTSFYATRQEGYNSIGFNGELVGATPIKVTIPNAYNPGNANGSDEIAISITNIYPGYAQAFRTDILNNGNIAAKLSDITIESDYVSGDEDVLNRIGIAILLSAECSEIYENNNLFGLADQIDNYIFTVGGIDFVRLSAFDDPAVSVALEDILLCLPSKNRMDLILGVAMDPLTGEAEGDNGDDAELSGVNFTIDLDWTQFNEGIGVDAPENVLVYQNR